ncbi:hypothetical protein [Halalkalicoccus salilacus]|uniref:hypothetical protein n=1 Tax=Halalkalicoccus salilacus TaxID=3117459 RepID=UPI00300F43A8
MRPATIGTLRTTVRTSGLHPNDGVDETRDRVPSVWGYRVPVRRDRATGAEVVA